MHACSGSTDFVPQTLITHCRRPLRQVKFFSPVILKDRRINEWLTLVEKEMRVSLARLLAMSVQDAAEFRKANIDQTHYLEWVDKYQVRLARLRGWGLQSKIIQKIRVNSISWWVGPGLTQNLCVCGKLSQNSPKPVLIFWSSIPLVFCLYIHC